MVWPTLFIMRGLPGSGKSTLAKIILRNWPANIAVVSADNYFVNNGVYKFEASKLKQAHDLCIYKCKVHLCQTTRRSVIVDNTNSRHWEYAPYLELAQLHEVAVRILEIPCPDETTLVTFQRRNTHNVSMSTMLNMRRRWEADPRATMVQNKQDIQNILAARS